MTTFQQSGVIVDSITKNGKYEPFELQVSRNLISYHSTVSIFGYQSAISTTSIPVWENATAYTYPSSALAMTYASTSSETLTMVVSGLDASYNPAVDTVTFTAGTTGTAAGGVSFFRINSMSVTTVGTPGTSNVGTITAKNGGTTYAQINPGVGRTQMSIYTVPNGFTLYLNRIQGFTNTTYTSSSYATYKVQTINSSGVLSVFAQRPFISNFIVNREYPNIYGQKSDCQWQMQASTGTLAGSIQLEGVLVQTDGSL